MNVNFTVFIDKILSGEKHQTIRKAGKKWDKVKVGDKLTLYTGLRTKECQKLGEAEVESIEDVNIYIMNFDRPNENYFVSYKLRHLNVLEIEELAENDGFEKIRDFFEFFKNHYGKDFQGKIIKWKNFRKAE